MITFPAMALERVRFEIGHTGEIISAKLTRLVEGFLQWNKQKFDDVIMLDDNVDVLNDAILVYPGDIRHQPLTDRVSDQFQRLMAAAVNRESPVDGSEGELVSIGGTFLDQDLHASDTTRRCCAGSPDRSSWRSTVSSRRSVRMTKPRQPES
jgi:Na+/phosphate symporter